MVLERNNSVEEFSTSRDKNMELSTIEQNPGLAELLYQY